ncbi:olfactory receptor 13C2-like [Rana temporaria]|uniref:olfactory receptor 13C2-like n=1 Tax=Rana temporaria TaxID=8407 RepID=UPI001AAD30F0|nr:olfactory receptor 13C2-like [Rana temporaria]
MTAENQSIVMEFILLGLTDNPSIQLWLFQLFSLVYMTTLAGNILLILAVRTDNHLHNPMYIFLSNLSFLDICYTSIIVPKMLLNIVLSTKKISYTGCVLQVYFYLFMGETECILLGFMAYDRYVAICNPLRYNVIMNTVSCTRMIGASWVAGGSIASFDIYFICQLKFCGHVTINHFFCEAPSLHQLSCGDISVNNIVTLVGGSILLLIPLCLILFSYIHIFLVVVKLPSGQYKAFSTCISHLIVVTIFYGTAIFMYMRPRYSDTEVTDKIVSVFYTIFTPMLNPLIYSLRNKDVQKALGHLGRSTVLLR